MNNLEKHAEEGYNLCDGVHCQAYKTRANKKEVTEGAYKSKGEVIVDSQGNIIETLFHSNSGGETVNAKDVWGKDVPYLVSVEDSFSVGGKHYQWEKYIKLKDWLNYFKNKGLKTKDKEIEDLKEVIEAVKYLTKTKTGALIVFKKAMSSMTYSERTSLSLIETLSPSLTTDT